MVRCLKQVELVFMNNFEDHSQHTKYYFIISSKKRSSAGTNSNTIVQAYVPTLDSDQHTKKKITFSKSLNQLRFVSKHDILYVMSSLNIKVGGENILKKVLC